MPVDVIGRRVSHDVGHLPLSTTYDGLVLPADHGEVSLDVGGRLLVLSAGVHDREHLEVGISLLGQLLSGANRGPCQVRASTSITRADDLTFP